MSSKARQEVITTQKAWETLWKDYSRGQKPAPPVPKVDFKKQIVLFLFLGQRPSTGYGIEMTRIIKKKGSVIVYFRESKPDPNSVVGATITYPCHIARIDKPKGKIKFIAEKKKDQPRK